MVQLIAHGIEKSFGDRVILRGCDVRVGPRDRIGLVGVNGGGKSTLLAVLAGILAPDGGDIDRHGRLGLLRQEATLPGVTVGDAADEAVAWHRRLLIDYEEALAAGDFDASAPLLDRLDHHGWEVDHRVDAILSRLGARPSGPGRGRRVRERRPAGRAGRAAGASAPPPAAGISPSTPCLRGRVGIRRGAH